MNDNLLIVGAGIYAVVAAEIARDMGCFARIDFIDDNKEYTPEGKRVIGKLCDLEELADEYDFIFIAIGNNTFRRKLIKHIYEETSYTIATLVSPKAYVSPSVKLGMGCCVEPMVVVHSLCELEAGCFISAGAVVNHGAKLEECVHVDCNATVKGLLVVPAENKVESGSVFS